MKSDGSTLHTPHPKRSARKSGSSTQSRKPCHGKKKRVLSIRIRQGTRYFRLPLVSTMMKRDDPRTSPLTVLMTLPVMRIGLSENLHKW